MKTPLSWLKEYVDINFPLKELMWKMTEVGLTTESYEKIDSEIVLDAEVTPNRPDWMSIIGIAREIAAIQSTTLKLPKLTNPPLPKSSLPLNIKNDFTLCPRYSAIIVKGVSQKPSPEWMQKRLLSVGLRPINNLVDITNYVMFETGNPIHVFDYDRLNNAQMAIMKSKGGESFVSVDEKYYSLPENAIIFKSGNEVIDLCGIKGGANSGISSSTTNILILVAVYNGQLIRRTSQRLGLWSEASRIFERGANSGGTLDTLKRACNLIQELGGGETASIIMDSKNNEFNPWKLSLSQNRLEKILGINIPEKEVLAILRRLILEPTIKNGVITCTIPTYRGDLKIEEDLIEEVARLYGYNNFPLTLPRGDIPTMTIPYYKDYNIDHKIKHTLTAAGYSEIQTYSLISERDIRDIGFDTEAVLRVDNPISREFEYLRPNLKPNLLKAMLQNKPYYQEVNLFEIGKVYKGITPKDAREEYEVAGISNIRNYFEVKGIIARLFIDFQITEAPEKFLEWNDEYVYFSFPYSLITNKKSGFKSFISLPKYPSIIEDMTFVFTDDTTVGEIIELIKKQSHLIKKIDLLVKYKNTRTFRITYQHIDRNLTTIDIAPIREKIINTLKIKNLQLK